MSAPLEVAVLWHMHQPDYRDKLKGRAVLPVGPAARRQGLLPDGGARRRVPRAAGDLQLRPLAARPARGLPRRAARSTSTSCSRRSPPGDLNQEGADLPAAQLLHGQPRHDDPAVPALPRTAGEARALRRSSATWSRRSAPSRAKDFLDLQVLFNLSWFGPYFLHDRPALPGAGRQGAGLHRGREGRPARAPARDRRPGRPAAAPAGRRGADRGLDDARSTTRSCRCSSTATAPGSRCPRSTLPHQAFRHPEDALAQVRKAIAFHERAFGERPQGIWPSEGSVSPAVLQLFQEQGLRWTATDENILFRSLGLPLNQDFYRSGKREELLYQPYRTESGTHGGLLPRPRPLRPRRLLLQPLGPAGRRRRLHRTGSRASPRSPAGGARGGSSR